MNIAREWAVGAWGGGVGADACGPGQQGKRGALSRGGVGDPAGRGRLSPAFSVAVDGRASGFWHMAKNFLPAAFGPFS